MEQAVLNVQCSFDNDRKLKSLDWFWMTLEHTHTKSVIVTPTELILWMEPKLKVSQFMNTCVCGLMIGSLLKQVHEFTKKMCTGSSHVSRIIEVALQLFNQLSCQSWTIAMLYTCMRAHSRWEPSVQFITVLFVLSLETILDCITVNDTRRWARVSASDGKDTNSFCQW